MHKTPLINVLFISAIALAGHSTSAQQASAAPKLLPGDIIFHESQSGQAAAIKEVTGSRFTHCGIVVLRDGRLHVAEAIEPVRVNPTKQNKVFTLDEWVARGVAGYAEVKRVRGGISESRLQQLEASMGRFQGKPYDKLFQWNDDRIYCSEFIYDSFNDESLDDSLRLKLGTVQKFGDLPLDGPLATELIKKRYTEAGKQLDPLEQIITPVAIMNDPQLETVAIFEGGKPHPPH
jgi:hypothetical protein